MRLARRQRPLPAATLLLLALFGFPCLTPGAGTAQAVLPRTVLEVAGRAPGAQFGQTLAAIGDFTGDGIADVAVGVPCGGPSVSDSTGLVLVYSGGTLDAEPALVLAGESRGSLFGFSIYGQGDANGDGFADLLVCAPGYAYPNPTVAGSGRAYVFHGGPLRDALPDQVIDSPRLIYGWHVNGFGISCDGIGDIDGDGREDWAFGAQSAGASGGAIVVLSTERGNLLSNRMLLSGGSFVRVAGIGDADGDGVPDVAVGVPYSSDLRAGSVRIHSALTEYGEVASIILTSRATNFGAAIAPAGDLNGDGLGDLIIGQPAAGGFGAAYLWFGNRGGSAALMTIPPPVAPAPDSFGVSVAVGDVDGDGRPELLVGACGDDQGGANAGATYVYRVAGVGAPTLMATIRGRPADYSGYSTVVEGGRRGGRGRRLLVAAPQSADSDPRAGRVRWVTLTPHSLAEPHGPAEWTAAGEGRVRWSGSAPADVALSLDDGLSWRTLAASAGGAEANEITVAVPDTVTGRARVRVTPAGASGAALLERDRSEHAFSIVRERPAIPAAARRAALHEATQSDERFGAALAELRPPSGGGERLLVVGAPYADGAWRNAGRVVAIRASGEVAAAVEGEATGDRFGSAVATGDVDRDGQPDVLVGSPGRDAGGLDAGGALLFLGGLEAAPLKLDDDLAGGAAGSSVAILADWNGDGFADFAVGAPTHAALGAESSGRVALWHGGTDPDAVPERILTAPVGAGGFGAALATGDFNADGASDLAVSATWTSGPVGRVFVYFGGGGADGVADREYRSNRAGDDFGAALAAGDVNGDGVDDLLVGAPDGEGVNGVTGRVYLYLGNPDPARETWRTFEGRLPGERFGSALCVAGDLDRNGTRDVVAAAAGAHGGRGECRVLIPSDGSTSVVWSGESGEGGLGLALAAADLDGDGAAEVYAGSPYFSGAGLRDAGRVSRLDSPRYVIESPREATRWFAGGRYAIAWRGAEPADAALSVDGGATWETLATAAGGSAGNSLEFVCPTAPTDSAWVRLVATRPGLPASDVRSGPFAIGSAVAVTRFEHELTEAGIRLTWATEPGLGAQGLGAYRIYREAVEGGARARVGPERIEAGELLVAEFERGATYVLVGVDGNGMEADLGRVTVAAPLARLRAWPVPSTEFGDVELAVFPPVDAGGRTAADFRVTVYDVSGRAVRTLLRGAMGTRVGEVRAGWDRRTDEGAEAKAGVYFVRAESPSRGFRIERRIVVVK